MIRFFLSICTRVDYRQETILYFPIKFDGKMRKQINFITVFLLIYFHCGAITMNCRLKWNVLWMKHKDFISDTEQSNLIGKKTQFFKL